MTCSRLYEIVGGDRLTAREMTVLRCLAQGKTSLEIGREMFVAVDTVKLYRKMIIAKLHARNSTHAVVIAATTGLLDLAEIVGDLE